MMTCTANTKYFRRDRGSNNSLFRSYIGFSHPEHNFAMLFLDSQVRKNAGKKFIQALSGYISFINCTAIKMFSTFGNNFFPIMNAQKFMEPFHNGFINRGKFKNSSMNDRINTCLSFNGVDVKTSISVDITSEIRKIKLFHNDSFTIVYENEEYLSTVNDLASGIRKDMRKSDLTTKA